MKLLNISDAAKLLGVSASTLRRLEQDGIVEGYGLKVIYTPGGQRRYMLDEIQHLYTQKGYSGQIGFGKTPALLIRDLTTAFTDPNSKFSIQLSGQIEAAYQLIRTAIENHIPIIFTKTIYDPTNKFSKAWITKFPHLEVLDRSSSWIKTHPELIDFTYDMINATVYVDDFFNSPVGEFLNQRQIDTVILAGATTSGSIRATAVEAFQRGYRVIICEEAVGDRSEVLQSTNLLDLNARYADVVHLDRIIKYMKDYGANIETAK